MVAETRPTRPTKLYKIILREVVRWVSDFGGQSRQLSMVYMNRATVGGLRPTIATISIRWLRGSRAQIPAPDSGHCGCTVVNCAAVCHAVYRQCGMIETIAVILAVLFGALGMTLLLWGTSQGSTIPQVVK